MKRISVRLSFEVTAELERAIIRKARKLPDADFYGDDNLRDAIHELIEASILADKLLCAASKSTITDRAQNITRRGVLKEACK